MKKILIASLGLFALISNASAQKWSDLSNEEKVSKLSGFIEDNHKYMKDSLKLSNEQINDVDNVNICYLSTLDRIDRYVKTDANKEKFAKAATEARSFQLEAIMGAEKRTKFVNYVKAKLKKASSKPA